MSEKRVIAVIVEGPSEEAALGSILKEYFDSAEVQFVVIHGDITTRDYASANNIIKKIDTQINSVKQRYSYKTSDFLKIIHIVDTDGVFCKDVIVEADTEDVQYYPDRIETKYPNYLKNKHKQKADVLLTLYSTGKINGIRYRVYFNSCNLEHVLFNELKSYTDLEKEDMADDFAERYEGKADEFIEFISDPEIAVEGTFLQTWKYIGKSRNSLERHSNMHLIFQ